MSRLNSTIFTSHYLLTQRSGLKFIRFLFPLPFPRFEESTEGRKFTFPFQGRRSRARAQTVCSQSSTILLLRCKQKKNNLILYNSRYDAFHAYVEQIEFLILLTRFAEPKIWSLHVWNHFLTHYYLYKVMILKFIIIIKYTLRLLKTIIYTNVN